MLQILAPLENKVKGIQSAIAQKQSEMAMLTAKQRILEKEILNLINEKLPLANQTIGVVKAVVAQVGDVALLEDKELCDASVKNLERAVGVFKWQPNSAIFLTNNGQTFNTLQSMYQHPPMLVSACADVAPLSSPGVFRWNVVVQAGIGKVYMGVQHSSDPRQAVCITADSRSAFTIEQKSCELSGLGRTSSQLPYFRTNGRAFPILFLYRLK
jgi:hypothetical protein